MPARSPTAGAPPPHDGDPVVTAGAPRGGTEVVVLALHGRGATAQGVVNLLEPAYRHGVTFLTPDAHRSRWHPHASTAPRERNEPDVSSAIAVVDATFFRSPHYTLFPSVVADYYGVERSSTNDALGALLLRPPGESTSESDAPAASAD